MMSRYFSSDLAQERYVIGPSSLVASVGIFLLINILSFGGSGVDVLVSGLGEGDPGGGFSIRGYASGALLDPAVLLIYIE